MLEKSAQYLCLFLSGAAAYGQNVQVAQDALSSAAGPLVVNASVSLADFPYYSGVSPTCIYDYVNFQKLPLANPAFEVPLSNCLFNASKSPIPEIDSDSVGFLGLSHLYQSLSSTTDYNHMSWANLEHVNQELEGFKYQLGRVEQNPPKDMSAESIDWTLHLDNAKSDLDRLSVAIEDAQHKTCQSQERVEIPVISSRELNLLQDAKKGGNEDRLVLHVIGDVFGSGTSLEGSQPIIMGEFLHSVLDSGLIDAELKAEDASMKIKEELALNLERYKKLEKLRNIDQHAFVQTFRKELSSLEAGKSILLSGGWSGESSGHSILYKISKDEQGRINFKLYNTGQGTAEYHQSHFFGDSKLILAEKEIVGVDPDKLMQHAFLRTLFILDEKPNDSWGPQILYDIILPELGGEVVEKEYSSDELYRPQTSGTCTYQALTAYLHSLFKDKVQYYRADFKIKLKTLVDYAENHSGDEFASDEQKRKLAEKSTTFLAREAIRLHHEGIITPEEFRQASAFLSRFKLHLQLVESKADHLHKVDLMQKNFTLNATLSKRFDPILSNNLEFQVGEIEAIDSSYYVETFAQDLPLTEENFFVQFKAFRDHAQRLLDNQEYQAAQVAVEEFTSRLSFSETSTIGRVRINQVLSELSETELIEFLEQVRDLTYCNYAATYDRFEQEDRSGHEPVTFNADLNPVTALSQMKLTVFANEAFNYLLKLKGLKPKSILPPEFNYIFSGENLHFLLFSPEKETEYTELLHFLKTQSSLSKKMPAALFEFEGDITFPLDKEKAKDVELFNWDYLRTEEFAKNYDDQFSTTYNKVTGLLPFAGKDLSEMTFTEKKRALFTDTGNYPTALPGWYYSTRDLSLLSSFMMRSIYLDKDLFRFSRNHAPEGRSIPSYLDMNYDLWEKKYEQGNPWHFIPNLFGTYLLKNPPTQSDTFFNYRKEIPPYSGFKELGGPQLPQLREEEELHCDAKEIVESMGRGRNGPGTLRGSHGGLIEYQQFREFASLFMQPDLQLINTLGYFNDNILSLANEYMQGGFEYLLYGHGHLMRELSSDSEEASLLIQGFEDLFSQGVELSLKLSDPHLLSFFAENLIRFNRYIEFASPHIPNVTHHSKSLSKLQSSIEKVLESTSLSDEDQRSLLMLHSIIHLEKKEITAENWTQILTNYLRIEATYTTTLSAGKKTKVRVPINKHSGHSKGKEGLNFDFNRLLDQKLIEFEKILDMNVLGPILNNLIQSSTHTIVEDLEWSRRSPYVYESTNKLVQINLKTGDVRLAGEELGKFDTRKLSSSLKGLEIDFNQADVTVLKGQYEIKLANGLRLKAFIDSDGKIGQPTQLFHNGSWFQLEFSSNSFPHKDLRSLYADIKQGKEKLTEEISTSLDAFKKEHLSPMPQSMLDNPRLRLAFSKDWTDFLVLNIDSKQIEYKLTLQNKEGIPAFQKLDPYTGEVTHEIIHKEDPSLADWRYLYHFESESGVLFWKSTDFNMLDMVELPAYSLTFKKGEVNGQEQLMCAQERGFFISSDQYVENMGNFAGFLVLENKDGVKKVLISNRQLINSPGGTSLKSEYHYPSIEKRNSYTLFPLTEKREIKLSGLSKAQKLQLSSIYLSEHRYQMAEEILLSTASSSIAPFSEDEVFHLLNLIDLRKSSDPRAYYIKAKAAHLLIQNYLDFFVKPTREILETIKQVLEAYLPFMDHEHAPFLTAKERSDLLSLYSSYLDDEEALNGLVSVHEGKKLIQDSILHDQVRLARPVSGISRLVELQNEKELLSLPSFSRNREIKVSASLFMDDHTAGKPVVFLDNLNQLFSLVRDQSDSIANKVKIAKELLNLDLPADISRKDLKEELKTAFRLMARAATFDTWMTQPRVPEKQWLIFVLNAMAHDPESFPSYQELLKIYPKKMKLGLSDTVINYFKEWIYPTDPEVDFDIGGDDYNIGRDVTRSALDYYKGLSGDEKGGVVEKGEALSSEQCFSRVLEDLKDSFELPAPSALNQTKATLHVPLLDDEVFISSRSPVQSSSMLNLSPGKEPLEQLEIETLQSTIQSYQNKTQKEVLRPLDLFRANDLKTELEEKIRLESQALHETQVKLIQLANKVPQSPVRLAQREAQVAAGGYHPIEIKDLTLLFLEKDFNAYLKLNSDLTVEDTIALQEQVQAYLLQSTYLSHLRRSSQALGRYIEFGASGGDLYQEPRVLKDLRKTLTLTRHYSLEEHPEMLVFEEALGIILRQDQVENIDKLIQEGGPNRVLEMVVGAGKTFVLSPLIAKHNADGKQLSIMMMPEELFPSMSQEIEESLSGTFRTFVQGFNFDRSQTLTLDRLKWVRRQLNDTIVNKKVLMITPRSIQSLYLMAIETLYQFEKEINPVERQTRFKEINEYKEILKLFKEKGNVLVDEIDLVLHPLREHHFTYKATLPNYEVLGHMSSIYDLVAREFPELLDLYSNPGTQVFSAQKYNRDLKPKLIQRILHGDYATQNKRLSAFLADSKNLDLAERFLTNTHQSSEFEGVDLYVKDRLALAKEMLDTLLPLTLSKSVDEHFGLSKEDTALQTAIPYHGSNHPAEGSRFGTFYESTAYTYQYYLKKGISKELIRPLLDRLATSFAEQLRKSAGLGDKNFSNTQAYQTLVRISPRFSDIKYVTNIDAHIDELHALINEDPKAILNFVRHHILPQLKVNDHHIRVGPELYNWLFKKVNGFTGTLWNSEAFSEGMEPHFSSKATGKILTLLMDHSSENFQLISAVKNLSELTLSLINLKNQEGVQAIIDAGAYYKGYSGLEVAHSILDREVLQERAVPVRGVIFYDDQDQLKVLVKLNGKRELHDYQEGDFRLEELITFYDQKHTTGSNIPQSLTAMGIVTVGPHMKLRDLIQSSGRMRKLDEGQTIRFAFSEDVFSLALERNEEAKLDLSSLISFTLQNQVEEKVRNNYRALKSKLDSAIEFSIMEKFLFGDLSESQSQALLTKFKETFLLEEKIAPFDQFQFSGEETKTAELITKAIESFEKRASKLKASGIELKGFATVEERQKLYDKHLRILPETLVERKGNYEFEMQVEVDTKKQKEVETEVENEVNVEKETAFDYRQDRCVNLPSDFFDFNPSSSLVAGQPLFPVSQVNSTDPFPEAPVLPLVPVYSLVQTFMKDEFSFFDEALMATKGILPFNIYEPFAFQMRIPRHVLVLQDKQTHDFKFVMLDEKTAATIKTAEIGHLVPDGANYKLALYHPAIDAFSRSSEDPSKILAQDTVRAHPKFDLLNVQMKFFKGDVAYTPGEIKLLNQFLLFKAGELSEKNGIAPPEALKEARKGVRALFEVIIANKDTSKRLYKDSSIYEYLVDEEERKELALMKEFNKVILEKLEIYGEKKRLALMEKNDGSLLNKIANYARRNEAALMEELAEVFVRESTNYAQEHQVSLLDAVKVKEVEESASLSCDQIFDRIISELE